MEAKNLKRKNLLHIVTKLHALFTEFQPENSLDYELSIKVALAIERWCACEGTAGLKRAKTMSNLLVRQLMATEITLVPLSNRYKRFVHKALLNCTCTTSKIYWVSVFSIFRLYYTKPIVDITTITSSFKGSLTDLLSFKYFKILSQVNKSFSNSVPPLQNWECIFE
jgi:hypothetical protein